MAIELYDASIPFIQKMLSNSKWIMTKSKQNADERGIDFTVLVNSRLAPDMYPLSKQIQIMCDMAKGCAARLSGQDVPSWEDNEKTYEELVARIDKTLDFVSSVQASDINGQEDRQIHVKTPNRSLEFKAVDYVQGFVIPNLMFHMTTSYNILRHNGVPLSKYDFVAGEAASK
ncbi:MAG TPA: DUF1993 domain-containing protein [Gammaproteobacteria bacterium]|nr:hypothetical protein [Gammaproteobacteria bacterium]MEC8010878.1 DUF1993 domain-containing protein [Pseudomonadota bacterium]HBF06775.1 DUF1993 domain-containing protein [Gammaproteobacteria bacterium]HCK91613.1 DUF1993 domain-containing protein [Gammaproteobacteria bacterium]|tara:strand:+ start:45977 stop:46495 length:519 start_codon:yes stop_codon:yes gene_type:complete